MGLPACGRQPWIEMMPPSHAPRSSVKVRALGASLAETRLFGTRTPRRRMNALAAGQLALTMLLLVGAGLLLRSFVARVLVDQLRRLPNLGLHRRQGPCDPVTAGHGRKRSPELAGCRQR